jgi:propionyl-CoA synthetase
VNASIEVSRVINYKGIIDKAIRLSDECSKEALDHVLVYNRPGLPDAKLAPGRDVVWNDSIKNADPVECVPVESDHPLYILYTSGTTGQPKGVQRPTGGHAVALAWTLEKVFDIHRGDIWWTAADLGWVVGHSYCCYDPLLIGATSIIYEGKPVGTPDPGQFFRVIQEHKVKNMFISPTALRSIKIQDHDCHEGGKYNKHHLENMFIAGEHCDQETLVWAEKAFKAKGIDHWWQTETGHPITSLCLGLGQKDFVLPKGVSGMPLPGFACKYDYSKISVRTVYKLFMLFQ